MATASRGHVLVVDDDHDLRLTVCDLLDACSFRATGARNLGEARRALATEQIDVILLDYNLGNGETACPLLDELDGDDRAPPAVLFSASTAAKDVAHRYDLLRVPKPFEVDELEARLFEAMRD